MFGSNIVSSSSRSKVLEEFLVEHLFFQGDDNMLPKTSGFDYLLTQHLFLLEEKNCQNLCIVLQKYLNVF